MIWAVDDDLKISESLQNLLSRAGYGVKTFSNGPAVISRLEKDGESPHLILLDVTMPGMDGFKVCHHIRRTLDYYIPIIMLTARTETPDKLLGLEIGADVYLCKPFDPEELLAQIKSLIRLVNKIETSSNERDADLKELPLICGSLVLWRQSHRVELSGQLLELTPKEFELLCLLIKSPNRVFGRETLLREVWGYDYIGDSRTVDVHVQRLRAKLQASGDDVQLIQTVRGFGYRLTCPSTIS